MICAVCSSIKAQIQMILHTGSYLYPNILIVQCQISIKGRSALIPNIRLGYRGSDDIPRLLYPIYKVHNAELELVGPNLASKKLSWLLDEFEPAWRKWRLERRMMFALNCCM